MNKNYEELVFAPRPVGSLGQIITSAIGVGFYIGLLAVGGLIFFVLNGCWCGL